MREFTDDELRQMFEFVRRDFEGFLELKRWMESLPEDRKAIQIEALQALHGAPSGQEVPKSGA